MAFFQVAETGGIVIAVHIPCLLFNVGLTCAFFPSCVVVDLLYLLFLCRH